MDKSTVTRRTQIIYLTGDQSDVKPNFRKFSVNCSRPVLFLKELSKDKGTLIEPCRVCKQPRGRRSNSMGRRLNNVLCAASAGICGSSAGTFGKIGMDVNGFFGISDHVPMDKTGFPMKIDSTIFFFFHFVGYYHQFGQNCHVIDGRVGQHWRLAFIY